MPSILADGSCAEATDLLRGRTGSQVQLSLRKKNDSIVTVTLTRAPLESSASCSPRKSARDTTRSGGSRDSASLQDLFSVLDAIEERQQATARQRSTTGSGSGALGESALGGGAEIPILRVENVESPPRFACVAAPSRAHLCESHVNIIL